MCSARCIILASILIAYNRRLSDTLDTERTTANSEMFRMRSRARSRFKFYTKVEGAYRSLSVSIILIIIGNPVVQPDSGRMEREREACKDKR